MEDIIRLLKRFYKILLSGIIIDLPDLTIEESEPIKRRALGLITVVNINQLPKTYHEEIAKDFEQRIMVMKLQKRFFNGK